MAPSEYAERQKFQTKDGAPLTSLQSHPCPGSTEERYVLWSDLQRAFPGIDHLENYRGKRILFMIDADGELLQPFGIFKNSYATYSVIYANNQRQLTSEELCDISQGRYERSQGDSQSLAHGEIKPSLKDLFETCKHLYQCSKTAANSQRDAFRQTAANTRHYHSTFKERVERLDTSRADILVDGKSPEKLLEELRDLEQQMPKWDHQSICTSTLCDRLASWGYTTSSIFLVLPSDLDSWDDSDTSTHQFRLYFLCDNWKHDGASEDIPQHVHLSNHPGYLLQRQHEFFQAYGDYVLRMLLMTKSGHSNKFYEIPPLDTLKILWGCDPDTLGSHINKDTIRLLVDKAIAYLQRLSPPKWTKNLALHRNQTTVIKTFLDVQDDHNSEGNLYHYIDLAQCVFWICQAHVRQYFNNESLEGLKEFIQSHGGWVDMKKGRLVVELGSPTEAEQFRILLKGCGLGFDISVKLAWNATRLCVKNLCTDIAVAGAVMLELDGITPNINPQGSDKHMHNLFEIEILRKTSLKFITLINYPRPQEQCIHFQQYSVQSPLRPAKFLHKRYELWSELKKFGISVISSQVVADYNTATADLHSALENHGLSDATLVTIHFLFWDGIFDLEKNTFIELLSNDLKCPKGVLCSGSLRTLGVHLNNAIFDQEFFRMVQTNTNLQNINVSYFGNDILSYTVDIIQMWHEFSNPFRLTLIDRLEDTQGRITAELAIGDDGGGSEISRLLGDNTFDFRGEEKSPKLRQQNNTDVSRNVIFKQWDCDHIFSQLSDYFAVLLSMAVQQYPSVLTLLSLDVSRLSTFGLISIQEILHRSNLENLNIKCTLIQPSHANTVAQVLDSVQWRTLKSLAILGNYINEWIELWPTLCESRLLCFHIQGVTPMQKLSHSSILFLQQLIFSSPLVELRFRDVQLQDQRDWVLVIDSMDLSLLQTLDLGEHGAMQFLSMQNAVGLFVSGLEASHLEGEGPKLILPSFSLDTTALSQPGLVNLQKIFRYCILEELVIKNDLIDFIMSRLVAKALNSLHRPLFEYLWLSGDDIIHWIQLLAKVEMSRLKILQILKEKLERQEISNANSLSIERLVGTSSLKELNFKDVLLQEQLEWGAPYQKDGSLHGKLLSERQQLGAGHVDPRHRGGIIEE